MSKKGYAIIDGKTKKIKKKYAVVDGKTRKIKKEYTIIDGKTRLFWSGGSEGKFLLSGYGVNGYSNPGGGYAMAINSFYTKDTDSTAIDINSRIGYGESDYYICFATDGKGRTVMAYGNDIYYSDDLITWTHCYNNTSINPYTTYYYIKIKYLNNNFVGLCNGYHVSFSSDGINWSTVKLADDQFATTLTDINYGNGVYIVTSGTKYSYYSKNLINNWNAVYL